MKKQNILFILLVMLSFGVFAQEPVKPTVTRSELVCEFPGGYPFWRTDRVAQGWVQNKPYDQLRVFNIPELPLKRYVQIYYLAQSQDLVEIVDDNFQLQPGADQSGQFTVISELESADRTRLGSFVYGNCDETVLNFESTEKALKNLRGFAGKEIGDNKRFPVDVNRTLQHYHDTATVAEATAHN